MSNEKNNNARTSSTETPGGFGSWLAERGKCMTEEPWLDTCSELDSLQRNMHASLDARFHPVSGRHNHQFRPATAAATRDLPPVPEPICYNEPEPVPASAPMPSHTTFPFPSSSDYLNWSWAPVPHWNLKHDPEPMSHTMRTAGTRPPILRRGFAGDTELSALSRAVDDITYEQRDIKASINANTELFVSLLKQFDALVNKLTHEEAVFNRLDCLEKRLRELEDGGKPADPVSETPAVQPETPVYSKEWQLQNPVDVAFCEDETAAVAAPVPAAASTDDAAAAQTAEPDTIFVRKYNSSNQFATIALKVPTGVVPQHVYEELSKLDRQLASIPVDETAAVAAPATATEAPAVLPETPATATETPAPETETPAPPPAPTSTSDAAAAESGYTTSVRYSPSGQSTTINLKVPKEAAPLFLQLEDAYKELSELDSNWSSYTCAFYHINYLVQKAAGEGTPESAIHSINCIKNLCDVMLHSPAISTRMREISKAMSRS